MREMSSAICGGFLMLNIEIGDINTKFAKAIILSFYNKNLLTSDEYIAISKKLDSFDIYIDIITLKSDICM